MPPPRGSSLVATKPPSSAEVTASVISALLLRAERRCDLRSRQVAWSHARPSFPVSRPMSGNEETRWKRTGNGFGNERAYLCNLGNETRIGLSCNVETKASFFRRLVSIGEKVFPAFDLNAARRLRSFRQFAHRAFGRAHRLCDVFVRFRLQPLLSQAGFLYLGDADKSSGRSGGKVTRSKRGTNSIALKDDEKIVSKAWVRGGRCRRHRLRN